MIVLYAKARELLLNDIIDAGEYKQIKVEAEENIQKLEGKLADLMMHAGVNEDVEGLVYKALENLKKLDLLYMNADILGKRHIIGSIFPEKWVFDGTTHRTTKINEAALLIYQINSNLQNKKNRTGALKSNQSDLVPSKRKNWNT